MKISSFGSYRISFDSRVKGLSIDQSNLRTVHRAANYASLICKVTKMLQVLLEIIYSCKKVIHVKRSI